MKAFLMYVDRDFDLKRELPWNQEDLEQDLALPAVLEAMARDDQFLYDVAERALMSGVENSPEMIRYRQEILDDCTRNNGLVREIYQIASDAIVAERKIYWGIFSKYPPAILDRGVKVMNLYVEALKKLRKIADEKAGLFTSRGFRTFYDMIEKELDDEYLASIQDRLKDLKFPGGVLVSAQLGQGNKGANYILRKSEDRKKGWRERIFGPREPSFSFRLDDRDEQGSRALAELRDIGINLVANALAQSCDHILGFFTMVKTELAFYVGCLNLAETLAQINCPMTKPIPMPAEERSHLVAGLYDVSLALTLNRKVVGNDLSADGRSLIVITGANQGGKSTFLRSIGLSQLMMQAGMFVPAKSFQANVIDHLFTHYKREEDRSMNSGKLDEELSRMDAIVDAITPHSMVLFNESFAATNEKEGSEIARQIVTSLMEKRIKCVFVTHLYEFAHRVYRDGFQDVLFLRAERKEGGRRTFKLREGEPLRTSFGEDIYREVFNPATSN